MIKSKFLLLAALAITVLSSCGGGKRELPKNNEYPVITISAANAQMKTTYPATIKGIQDVEVRPKVSGFITKLYVHEGEAVRAGQVLLLTMPCISRQFAKLRLQWHQRKVALAVRKQA